MECYGCNNLTTVADGELWMHISELYDMESCWCMYLIGVIDGAKGCMYLAGRRVQGGTLKLFIRY